MKIETRELKKLILEKRSDYIQQAGISREKGDLYEANRLLGVEDGLALIYKMLEDIERVVAK